MAGASFRSERGPSTRTCGLGALVFFLVFYSGCNRPSAPAEAPDDAAPQRRNQVLHEECQITSPGAERLDANGDGRADITIVRAQGREVCRAADINFDGVVDTWSYSDPSGQLRRREHDFDRDGQIDEIAIYQLGVVRQKQRATTSVGRLDTWEYYNNGVLTRADRDSDGDGVIDQWWEFNQPGCPLMHADANRDGKPDVGTTIDYCKETGYVPPERQSYRQAESPDFQRSDAVPTETDVTEVQGAGEAKPPEPKK
ncbi:MAG TPA: hypothetical protein VM686_33230 [Polyangiaceae bacterium]|nr:hypothetical protein [Polyangiaceae bacterium]